MLDERLTLAASLYEPCEWGADIGTDHGYLPRYLLKAGVCQQMIAADVSPDALENARSTLTRSRLLERAVLKLADGLEALDRPCGCVSVTGMGGDTMAALLRRGAHRLKGAALVLSAHTELAMVRQALCDIGYHIVREELCRAAGRFYVCWRAEPGYEEMPEEAVMFGTLLWSTENPLLKEYAAWRMRVAQKRLEGLRCAVSPDGNAIEEAEREAAFYRSKMEVLSC